uniref:Putative disease resistance protein RGA1 n=1 Tax=Davidia involucrata TaxID=16924 RepID=A0A5B6ZWB3_DAVIN
MAELILLNLAGKILLKLRSSDFQQIGLEWGVTKELRKLEKTISTVRNVLLDAQEQQVSNLAVREWLQWLKDIVYDADNLVDEFATEALRRQVEIHGSILREVRYFFTRSNPFKFRYGMGRKIRDVREKLDEVVEDMRVFQFVVRLVDSPVEKTTRIREETYSFVRSLDVIGRENDKKAIIQLLMDEEDVSIIPIVGLGGLGKTTLAQLVYNDDAFTSQFDEKLWVCISDDFDTSKVIEKILKAKEGVDSNNLGIEQLQSRLRQILANRKFFLVLDDVWNERTL